MRLIVAAVGRLKEPERELFDRYATRCDASGRGACRGGAGFSFEMRKRRPL